MCDSQSYPTLARTTDTVSLDCSRSFSTESEGVLGLRRTSNERPSGKLASHFSAESLNM